MKLGGHKTSDLEYLDAKNTATDKSAAPTPPKLVSRREHRRSTLVSGRTIGERRERLETASERTAAREKVKKKQTRRLMSTIVFYIALASLAIFVGIKLFSPREEEAGIDDSATSTTIVIPYAPTIEVVDEAASATGGHLTSTMKEYIGQVEVDLREFGYTPTRAVIPNGAVREVDFYLDGFTGYIKFVTDRGAGVSTEDADRMLRYLASIDVHDFEYIDVRIDGKAYWK